MHTVVKDFAVNSYSLDFLSKKHNLPKSTIVKMVRAYADKTKSDRMVRTTSHKMRIIGIYTPATRCLQTTFSITLGQMLARQRKTLYLNFEAYSGLGKMLNRQFQRDLSDLVYYLNCARDKLFYHMEGMESFTSYLSILQRSLFMRITSHPNSIFLSAAYQSILSSTPPDSGNAPSILIAASFLWLNAWSSIGFVHSLIFCNL